MPPLAMLTTGAFSRSWVRTADAAGGISSRSRLTFFAGAKKVSKESTLYTHGSSGAERSLRSGRWLIDALAKHCSTVHDLARPRCAVRQRTGPPAAPDNSKWWHADPWWSSAPADRWPAAVPSRGLSSKALRDPQRQISGAQRSMTEEEPSALQVLSLLTFFAPAKKVSRPRGRPPPPGALAVRTQDGENANDRQQSAVSCLT